MFFYALTGAETSSLSLSPRVRQRERAREVNEIFQNFHFFKNINLIHLIVFKFHLYTCCNILLLETLYLLGTFFFSIVMNTYQL